MRKIMNVILMVASLLLALGLLLSLGAETNRPGAAERARGIDIRKEEIPRLVQIIKVWKLVDELELNEEQLVEFLPRFKQLDSLRNDYYRDRRKIIREMERLLEKNSQEDQLKPVIDEYNSTETRFYQKYSQLREELNSNLTVIQQAKFIVFQDRYREDMHRLIRNLRELSDLREEQRLRSQPVPLKQQKKE